MNEISINLISTETLDKLESEKKVRYIIDEVKSGKVLILERGLYAIEEARLIETTMREIDHETFIGIEMQSYNKEDVKKGSWLKKLLRREAKPRMSVIGPADLLKTIRKDGNSIEAMILTKEFIVREKVKENELRDKNQTNLEYFGDKENNEEKISIVNQEMKNQTSETKDSIPENLNQELSKEDEENKEIEKELKSSFLKRFIKFGKKEENEEKAKSFFSRFREEKSEEKDK